MPLLFTYGIRPFLHDDLIKYLLIEIRCDVSSTNWPVMLKVARGLKFRIEIVEGVHIAKTNAMISCPSCGQQRL